MDESKWNVCDEEIHGEMSFDHNPEYSHQVAFYLTTKSIKWL